MYVPSWYCLLAIFRISGLTLFLLKTKLFTRSTLTYPFSGHRIVTADRKIGGFSGATSGPLIAKKIELLRSEGVSFTDGEADETKCFSAFDKEALETTNLGQEMKKWRGESSKWWIASGKCRKAYKNRRTFSGDKVEMKEIHCGRDSTSQ